MSYIPKYIIKRMIPKNSVSIDGDYIKVEMINVISPISIDEVPDDVLNYLEVKIDGNDVADLSGLKVKWGDNEYTIDNIKEAVGQTLPVGDKLIIYIPNSAGVKSGEEHEFEVTIKSDNPINIKFKRTIQ